MTRLPQRSHAALLALLALLPLTESRLRAEETNRPFLHPLFARHMVVQRDRPIPVWGWTAPGAEVRVALADRTGRAVADRSGRWQVRLEPLPAGGPHTLTVEGPQTVRVEDVLAGDVWLCSGQSNMQMPVKGALNAKEELAAASHPRIRSFTVP